MSPPLDPTSAPATAPDEEVVVLPSAPRGEEAVLALFGLSGAERAIVSTNFTHEELVETLINHVRSPDPTVSLRAATSLMRHMENIAKLSGRIAKTKLERTTTDAEGNKSREASISAVLLSRLSQGRDQAVTTHPHGTLLPPAPSPS